MNTDIAQQFGLPGYWERRDSRFPLPMSNHLWELVAPARYQGMRRAFERYGCAIESFEFTRLHGRQYVQARYVQDRDRLAQRRQIAEHVLAAKLWRNDGVEWPAFRDAFRLRLIDFVRRDPNRMNVAELQENIIKLRAIFIEGTIKHFVQQPASMLPVGDWVRRTCEWTGVPTAEIIATLQTCPFGFGSQLPVIDDLVESIRSNPAAAQIVRAGTGCPKERLEHLRHVSVEIAERFDAYIEEYADRIMTGFDITEMTLRELPEVTMSTIASRLDSPPPKHADPSRLEKIRDRVPPAKRAEFEEGLAEAAAAYGLHDEDVRITYLWPLGLLRRSVLAAGGRLVRGKMLRAAEDIFHATPAELDSLMSGASSPSLAELSQRAEQWWVWANDEPRASFGERSPAPDRGILGSACERITSAIMFYLSETENLPHPSSMKSPLVLQGLAASPGCYQGRARIIRDPADFAKLTQGDVLVARTTSPAYNVVLPTVGAIVTDRGGTLSHAAIIAREFSIPAVVGTNQATLHIPEGARVLVDGNRGFVAVRA
jgi:rifampicin phosphotransferase